MMAFIPLIEILPGINGQMFNKLLDTIIRNDQKAFDK
jgi:hypothetical protein